MDSANTKPKLIMIVGSTRPGRAGEPISEWLHKAAQDDGRFEIDFADLADINLPVMDEPNHPRMKNYTKDHTKAWSKRVDAADAVIWITPEYNHSYPASLKNAIDYLSQEWQHKPLGLASYGGVAGGTRAAQALKPVAAVLKLVPLNESVVIPNFQRFMQEDGTFEPEDVIKDAATAMFESLEKWVDVLKPQRAG